LKKPEPLVSVIIPFYNQIDWTAQAVESVLKQTYQQFEIILVNDGSIEPIDKLISMGDPRISILHQQNRGPAAARNHGIRQAKGDYIALLDSDDIFLPEKLAHQVEVHKQNPRVWLSHTSYQRFTNVGKTSAIDERLEVIHSGEYSGNLYPKIFCDCPIATPTVMFRREVVEHDIWYEESYRINEDVIFYSKIAYFSEIIGLDTPLTLVRMSDNTHSTDPYCLIAGAQNIRHYILHKRPALTFSEKKSLLCTISYYIAFYYSSLRKPFYFVLYLLRSYVLAPPMRDRIPGLNYPDIFFLLRKAKSIIRRIIGYNWSNQGKIKKKGN
jgi:glycosyltransferase involved in cell wall biosynthesis